MLIENDPYKGGAKLHRDLGGVALLSSTCFTEIFNSITREMYWSWSFIKLLQSGQNGFLTLITYATVLKLFDVKLLWKPSQ